MRFISLTLMTGTASHLKENIPFPYDPRVKKTVNMPPAFCHREPGISLEVEAMMGAGSRSVKLTHSLNSVDYRGEAQVSALGKGLVFDRRCVNSCLVAPIGKNIFVGTFNAPHDSQNQFTKGKIILVFVEATWLSEKPS